MQNFYYSFFRYCMYFCLISQFIMCDDPFFFSLQIICINMNLSKIQMDHHSGTMMCCKANTWYMPHKIYLIIKV